MALAIDAVTKTFPGVVALDGASLALKAGEIHALMGENGAGKSTLIKIITGLYRPEAGRVLLDGEEVHFHTPRAALSAGISAVHQERNLIPRFSVGENILLERLPARGGLVDYGRVEREARRWLAALDLDLDPRVPVARLSVAQMQLVEIAKALSLEARILLMDEPTASITDHETHTLFSLLKRLRDEGVAILFVSHKLEEVFALCDRVTVLRDGRNAALGEPLARMTRQRLVSLMIGREERLPDLPPRPPSRREPVLELCGVATAEGHAGIDLTLHRGEILGLYGLVGAGRSELAKAVIGASRIIAGEVRVRGAPVRIRGVNEALHRHRLGYISEDRKGEGLILLHSVLKNVGITIWRRLAGALGLLGARREAASVRPFVQKLEVRTPSLGQPVGLLSGGNQQKVSVAKWLAANVEILIVDEPTVGIDIKTKGDLHELIWRLAAEGTAVLLITSDMPEMVGLADRILVMKEMRLIGELPNTRRYEEMSPRIMHVIHGMDEGPQAAEPADRTGIAAAAGRLGL